MDIPALSMAMSQGNLQTSVQLAIMNKVLDSSEMASVQMTDMMSNISVEPYKGKNIDVTV